MFCHNFFVQREISEMHQPINVKFCMVISTRPSFIMPVRLRYSKSIKYLIYDDSSHVRRNKSGEVRCSNHRDLDVKWYPPKAPFSEDHILTPTKWCDPKFLHAIENDQVLLAHSPSGMGTPLHFFSKGAKNGLKFSI